MSKRKTEEEFISQCVEKFPLYNYTKSKYLNNKTKVIIICPEHGEFDMLPNSFIKSSGCPRCGKRNKLTKSEVLALANHVHGNRYDYDLTNYKNTSSKIPILCKKHGWFYMKINNHIHLGQKCKLCEPYQLGLITTKKHSTKKLTLEQVKSRFIEIHGNKYSYINLNEYVNNQQRITVLCKEHGEFNITINKHLQGRGCPSCAKNKPYTNETLIKTLKRLEPSYNYNDVTYTGYHENITITCPKHGNFLCTPANFISCGNRCPNCSISKLENEVRNLLLKLNIPFIQQHTFEKLKAKKPLRFDFYLPNLKTIIECQGIQHFKYTHHFHKNRKAFEYQLHKDELKRKFCVDNNLLLLLYSDREITNNENVILSVVELEKQLLYVNRSN